MDLKDKIILIFYIGTKGCSRKEANTRLMNAEYSMERLRDDSCELLFAPNFDTDNNEVKCINPKFVTEEEYKEVEKVITELKEKLK